MQHEMLTNWPRPFESVFPTLASLCMYHIYRRILKVFWNWLMGARAPQEYALGGDNDPWLRSPCPHIN